MREGIREVARSWMLQDLSSHGKGSGFSSSAVGGHWRALGKGMTLSQWTFMSYLSGFWLENKL